MPAQQGIVTIVGAGPGDAGLLTVRGRALIDSADAIVYDAFVNREILPASARTSGSPELYYVGTRGEPGGKRRAVPQDEVRQLLVTLVRQGKRVVHLTADDPFVFGHGGEEAQAMHDAGIPFEIVPGVTAGVAAPAYAGIPVTHPGLATAVTFVTGRDDPEAEEKSGATTDWRALAQVGGTIVVYRGLSLLPVIAKEMMAGGLPGEIPAAAIRAGTRTEQRTVVATLETLAHEAALAGVTGRATVVIGWSVILRDEIAWFDTRPLFGKRIVLAQAGAESVTLQERLCGLGADVVAIPTPPVARLDLVPLREDIERLGSYAWIVFATPDAVALFWEQLLVTGRDTRALAGVKVCAAGGATAASLLDRGVTVDVLPSRFEVLALLDVLSRRSDVSGAHMLYVCDDGDDNVLPDGLTTLGADVIIRPVYRYLPGGAGGERIRRRLERGTVDLVVFTSPASVSRYLRAVGEEMGARAPAAVSDEATADAARRAGIEVVAETMSIDDRGVSDGSHAPVHGFIDTIVRALKTAS